MSDEPEQILLESKQTLFEVKQRPIELGHVLLESRQILSESNHDQLEPREDLLDVNQSLLETKQGALESLQVLLEANQSLSQSRQILPRLERIRAGLDRYLMESKQNAKQFEQERLETKHALLGLEHDKSRPERASTPSKLVQQLVELGREILLPVVSATSDQSEVLSDAIQIQIPVHVDERDCVDAVLKVSRLHRKHLHGEELLGPRHGHDADAFDGHWLRSRDDLGLDPASLSASSRTATARSTSRVKRTSPLTETARPPTTAKLRCNRPSSSAMRFSSRRGSASLISFEPQAESGVDLRVGLLRMTCAQGGTLQPEAGPHGFEGLPGALAGTRAARVLDRFALERIHAKKIAPHTCCGAPLRPTD